jgi:peptidoglycan-N-acetylglucosamine deacetylase
MGGRMALALCALLCAPAIAVPPAPAAQMVGARPPRVALTFDDLPSHGPLPPGVSRVDVARRILDALHRHQAPPTYGFINAQKLEDGPEHGEVLRLWRAAGHPLGNHAFSHMDLHANTVEAFERDILANEPALRSLMGDRGWQWFRFPYLREGDTPEKYRAARAALQRHGYRVAQVTIDFDDWGYNDPYARCAARGDAGGIARLERSYVERADESLTRSQDAARLIFGRAIDHVMLLHIGAFETVMLPRLLELLRRRGFVLITLEEAQADPAYAAVPERQGHWSGTLLEQLRPRDAASRERRDAFFREAGALCRDTP